MKPLKTKVSLTLDGPILEQIQILAERDDRSLSSYTTLEPTAQREDVENKNPP